MVGVTVGVTVGLIVGVGVGVVHGAEQDVPYVLNPLNG